jgi:DNA-binding response OmpR family regulator
VTELLGTVRQGQRHVLVVDDDQVVLALLERMLTAAGLRVTTLDDPLRLWEVLRQSSVDLLLLDVDMPNVNGIDLCRFVRRHQRWDGLPVFMLTAHSDPRTVQAVFEAGADEYINKQSIGPEVLWRIRNRLESPGSDRREERPIP